MERENMQVIMIKTTNMLIYKSGSEVENLFFGIHFLDAKYYNLKHFELFFS